MRLVFAAWVTVATAQDLSGFGEGEGDSLLDAVLEETLDAVRAPWWNADWSFRRRIRIEDAQLTMRRPRVVFFSNPDPLLLYNTGRCSRDLADLRVVARDGRVLPSGVLHFGRDDGSSVLWCVVGDDHDTSTLSAYLYYGNTDALPTGDELPGAPRSGASTLVALGDEEVAEGSNLPERAAAGHFFRELVSIEAEHLTATNAAGVSQVKKVVDAAAGARKVLELAGPATVPPVVAGARVEIPSAGDWYIHVRRKVAAGFSPEPLRLLLNGEVVSCRAAEDDGVYRWEHARAALGEGALQVGVEMSKDVVPDCIIITRDERYLPDCRDIGGPVWMRFKATTDASDRYYVHLFGMHTPYSAEGMKGDSACWLFRNRVALLASGRDEMLKDPALLLASEEFTPWGEALHSAAYTWFSVVTLIVPDGATKTADPPIVEFEFATRPDASRTFRSGVEEASPTRQIRVRMPTTLARDGYGGLSLTESFGQWAQRRFEMAEELGFKGGEGPTNIVAGTMAMAGDTRQELEYLLKTCQWLGLNLLDTSFHDRATLNELADRYSLHWTMDHHLAYGVGAEALTNAVAGKTWAETLVAGLEASADEVFRRHAARAASLAGPDGVGPARYPFVRYGILADEAAEAITSIQINRDPFNHALFVEFLEEQGLSPDFFGIETWAGLRAIDYAALHPKSLEYLEDHMAGLQAQLGARKAQDQSLTDRLAPEAEQADDAVGELLDDLAPATEEEDSEYVAELSAEDRDFLDWAAEVQRNQDAIESMQKGLATTHEKRIYHWTQKFKNDYYCTYYRTASAAAKKHFGPPFNASVNLQAMPVQSATMWSGQCNIFELGRKRAFDALHIEDWDGRTLHVAFAMNILRAAARKNHQELTALITGSNPGKRIVANLAQGTRYLLFYLYGPIHCIGPVWAEHQPTLREIGSAMRLAARCEADILAATNRPSDVAVLVANTTEINATYRQFGFAGERRAIYRALLDARLPVDVVGEQEIIEDEALARYRILYVGDSHVDSRVQVKIREWVRGGGVLWASGAALTCREYDEDSDALNETFGLTAGRDASPFRGPAGADASGDHAVTGCGSLEGMRFLSNRPVPALATSAAEVLALFETDAAPALLHHRFGKGHAFVLGCQLSRLSVAKEQSDAGAGADALRDIRMRMIAMPAEEAGVRPHVRVAAPGLWTWVHDGPTQTVVFIINEAGPDLDDLPIEVVLPRPPVSAMSGRTGDMEFDRTEVGASVHLSLARGECEILVFRN